MQTSLAKRGVINDWLNDWFGGSTAHQNLQSQGLLVAQNYHTISNDVRRLLPLSRLKQVWAISRRRSLDEFSLLLAVSSTGECNSM
jgi:hypothetical protein